MNVVCYGDSNTFGYDPRSCLGGRYDADNRWVDLLSTKTGWQIRNNGMNGREIPSREVVISKSTDILLIMLGTNDLLQGKSVQTVADRMECFLSRLTIEKKRILLVAPPPMQRGDWVADQTLIDASIMLAKAYKELAERLEISFADGGAWDVSIAFDGVHFTDDGHRAFAEGLFKYLKEKYSHIQ